MTGAPFISSASITAPSLRSMDRTQRELAEATSELASGRHADLAVELGASVRYSIMLRHEQSHLAAIRDANGIVAARLDGSQVALSSVRESAQILLSALLSAASDQTVPLTIVEQARQGLSTIRDTLNTTLDGVHLFAGVNTDAEPIADYFAASGSPARTAVGDAFIAAFGTSQSGAAVGGISASSAQAFLDTTFKDLFQPPSWQAVWSTASSEPTKSRIAPYLIAETSVTANEEPVRNIVSAFAMVADLGMENMNAEARKAVVDTSIRILSEAVIGAVSMEARLGVSKAAVSEANDRMTGTDRVMEHLLSGLEEVDPMQLSDRISSLTRDLEASYAIVARLNNLSLLDSL